MSLLVVGINHKTAPVKVREKFSFTKRQIEERLARLKGFCGLNGAVILSTCNRTEIYIEPPAGEGSSGIKPFIFDIFCAGENERGLYFYILEGRGALIHLFRVASGLDSQVLGETQILSQVKSGWLIARNIQVTSAPLDQAFEKALEVGRIVRSETRISEGDISIGTVAIDMLEEKFDDLRKCSVLIIGAGKIGALVSKYLRERKMRGIFVANRTYSKAMELAKSCSGRAVDFCSLGRELKSVDIVISSTSSPHVVLKKGMVAEIMRLRTKPLFIMDLALPRDVDPYVKEIKGVSLCGLDDLKIVVYANQKRKEAEAIIAEKIVQRELNNFAYSQAEHPALISR